MYSCQTAEFARNGVVPPAAPLVEAAVLAEMLRWGRVIQVDFVGPANVRRHMAQWGLGDGMTLRAATAQVVVDFVSA